MYATSHFEIRHRLYWQRHLGLRLCDFPHIFASAFVFLDNALSNITAVKFFFVVMTTVIFNNCAYKEL